MATLGELIKKYRLSNDLSIRAFAKKCDLSYSYIAMLERNKDPRGKTIVPTIATIDKVASGMGVDFDDLFKQLDPSSLVRVNETSEPPSYREGRVDYFLEHDMVLEHVETENDRSSILLKLLGSLTDKDVESLIQYAEFLKGKNKSND